MDPHTKYSKCFKPLESDPAIFTQLMHSLGVSEIFHFEDVLSIEEEFISTVPAVIVAFPETAKDEARKASEDGQRQHVLYEDVSFLKQTIDNACGLVAILHCVLNTDARHSLIQDSVLEKALFSNDGINKYLDSSEELKHKYKVAVEAGSTEIPEEVTYHYIALVKTSGHLYELDWERLSPLTRGSSSDMVMALQSFAQGYMYCSMFRLVQSETFE